MYIEQSVKVKEDRGRSRLDTMNGSLARAKRSEVSGVRKAMMALLVSSLIVVMLIVVM